MFHFEWFMAQAVAARVGGQTKKQTGWGRPAVPPPSRGRGIATARRGLCVAHKRAVRVGCFVILVVSMILPQVHLRKPCYDFSFLEMFRFK